MEKYNAILFLIYVNIIKKDSNILFHTKIIQTNSRAPESIVCIFSICIQVLPQTQCKSGKANSKKKIEYVHTYHFYDFPHFFCVVCRPRTAP